MEWNNPIDCGRPSSNGAPDIAPVRGRSPSRASQFPLRPLVGNVEVHVPLPRGVEAQARPEVQGAHLGPGPGLDAAHVPGAIQHELHDGPAQAHAAGEREDGQAADVGHGRVLGGVEEEAGRAQVAGGAGGGGAAGHQLEEGERDHGRARCEGGGWGGRCHR
jgi:hypothetical protein